ncbi:MAG: ABC transporter permease subunit [Clostridia bacterium]|nr:ABC transporter permease subunit [Clostridia bacterium]
MKVNKLARAELGKIFLRPAIYFMTAFLIFALILVTFSYSPTTRPSNLTNFGTATQNVSDVFSTFNNSTSTNSNSKVKLDLQLSDTYNQIQNFASASSIYDALIDDIVPLNTSITTSYDGSFLDKLHILSENPNNSTAISNFVTALTDVRQTSYELYEITNNIDGDLIDFYASTTEIASIKNIFYNIINVIPRTENLSLLNSQELITLGERIRNQFALTDTILLLQSFNKIVISPETLTSIFDSYYTNIVFVENSSNTLNLIYTEIEEFATDPENSSGESSEKILEINQLITKYKNAVGVATALLQNSFALEKAGTFSDATLRNYVGFEDFNAYILKENIALNSYLLENQIFDGEYFINYNFGTTIGYTETAYDFTFYAMQILSVIITIFCLFFTVTILAGEHINGTMKMLAIRPFKRERIISGKILSCIYFMTMFIIISAVAAFAVGYSMFGFTNGTMLLVFNATDVVALPAYAPLLLYLVSLGINIAFYICIAALLSVLFRSNTFALFVTFVVYFFGLLFNAISTGASWFVYTPYAHLDLFKFLGNSNSSGSLFGMNMIADGNFYFSLGYILGLILVINSITKIVFRRRDIA